LSSRPSVHILFTGGTISMKIDPVTGAATPALSGEEIVAQVPGLKKEARLVLEDYARLPGPHVTPNWMWRLKERAARLLRDPAVDALVITHGTDTLEETAFLLDLTLDTDKPVVFCGAMRTISQPGWDGPANLMTAVRAAVHPDSPGRGVLVTIGEEVHAASEATKRHTQNLAAFTSPLGPLGVLHGGRILYHKPARRPLHLPATRLVCEVDLHLMAAGVDDGLLRASISRRVRGLVIAGTGCGNVPPAVVPALRAALARRIVVLLVSRCPEGRVFPAYGYEGGGQKLREMGIILADDLPPQKARVKLMVALSLTQDPEELKTLFEARAPRTG